MGRVVGLEPTHNGATIRRVSRFTTPPHIESYDQSHMTLIIISHTARLVNSFSLFPSDFCKNLSLDYLRKKISAISFILYIYYIALKGYV